MSVSWGWCWVPLLITLSSANAASFDYPTANLSTLWTNSPSAPHSVEFTDGSLVRSILLRGSFGPRFACGFFCNGNCDTYLFAIFIVQTNSASYITSPSVGFPQVVWSANRNHPVRINATLELTFDGDLVLRDADGTIAWSTNTGGKSVVGLNLTDLGDLILFDSHNSTVWHSFGHPTDSLVPGQKLVAGQKLTASVSTTNWTEGGLFSLSVSNEGLFAFVESNPPQAYYVNRFSRRNTSKEASYIIFLNGSLSGPEYEVVSIPVASSAQYMRFVPDGRLKVYEWMSEWKEVGDLLTGYLGECNYPMVCGNYGLCSNGQCSCPASTYFKQKSDRQPTLGCSQITPLSCEASKYHSLVELTDVTYFTFSSDLENIDSDKCQRACIMNCSCKAAIFQYGWNSSAGSCYLPSEIFSMMNNEKEKTHYNSTVYNSTVYLKVQDIPSVSPGGNKTKPVKKILGFSLGSFSLLVLIGIFVFFFGMKKAADEVEELYLDQMPGLPTRFSYEDLKVMTEDFKKRLGEGGFGTVFEGTLSDGTKIAVKRLEGLGQIKKSFLAEVETIGSIQHVNLVRLIGFCADKSHRLLVYEFMPNGSLDRWIFHRSHEFMFDWRQRKKIILDIAKGLSYLHEDCRQKIVHLDIKPQNILLDDKFNAKVSDFGLAKLIDRDQSQVATTMRGTPGYMAPEWLSSVITEKVDIYSFGIVILEILSGRKNIDHSQPEEDRQLLSLFKKKAEEGKLLDLVGEDLQSNEEVEAVNMMKLAAWCLQSDFTTRPSMSTVVKVLEGVKEVEHNLNYNFFSPASTRTLDKVGYHKLNVSSSTPLLPSILSGPR